MIHSIIQDFYDGSFVKLSKYEDDRYLLKIVESDYDESVVKLNENELIKLKLHIESLLEYKFK